MVDTISNMQLAGLSSKPHGEKIIINFIDRAIGVGFYPPPGSVHYKLLGLYQFHVPYHINCEQNIKIEIKMTKISNAQNRTTKPA